MLQLQNKSDLFILKTFSGTKHLITSGQNNIIAKMGSSEKVTIGNGVTINTSAISLILPQSEYYKQFPDERPDDKPVSGTEDENIYKKEIQAFKNKIRTLGSKDAKFVTWDNSILYDWEYKFLKEKGIIYDFGIVNAKDYYIWTLAKKSYGRKK